MEGPWLYLELDFLFYQCRPFLFFFFLIGKRRYIYYTKKVGPGNPPKYTGSIQGNT